MINHQLTKQEKLYFFKQLFLVSIIFIAISSVVFLLGIKVMHNERKVELEASQRSKVMAERNLMEHMLDEAVLDLMTMSESQLFQNVFSGNSAFEQNQNSFNDLVENLFNQKSNYYQLRHLNTEGMEVFRIERRNGEPYICKTDELQDKSQRYYFIKSIGLQAGEFYVSPLDLNIEYGEIEIPFRPMIRICVPVIDQQGATIGVNVLNFDATGIILELDEDSKDLRGISFLTNEEGYFLNAKDSSQEWGFMYPDKKELTLEHVFLHDAEKIANTETGQFEGVAGLFTVAAVNPFIQLVDKDFAEKQKDSYSWKVISLIDSSQLGLQNILPINSLFWLYLLVVFTGLIFGYFYARVAQRKYQSQQALVRSEKDLKIANQSKSQFFSIISHDLKNASGTIANYLEFMQEAYDDFSEEERKSHLKDIGFAAKQHNKLLYDILDWARIQMGKVSVKPETILVDKLVEEQTQLVEIPLKNKGLRFEADLKDDLTVYGDREMIKTILRNLINNAIKFSHRESAIRIEAKDLMDRIELRIIDYGIGMREADSTKIFDISSKIQQSGTENESGTGFGLKLVAELVQKNKGTIRVESELGKGSAFVLNFPSGQ